MTLDGNSRSALMAILLVATLGFVGCSPLLEDSYGRSRGDSINGTGVFSGLIKARGHEVRAAVRLTDELRDWADVIVRFGAMPGPPPVDEANWYNNWLSSNFDNHLIYIPRDYDATHDYWSLAAEQLTTEASTRLRERIEQARDATQIKSPPGPSGLNPPKHASPQEWFEIESGKPSFVSKSLEGPWAEGVDPTAAAIPQHEVLKFDPKRTDLKTRLSGDQKPIASEWERPNGGKILVIGNGSFLLNAAIANPARRPLAHRVVEWVGLSEFDEGRTKNVAFVEGPFVMSKGSQEPSVFHLLTVPPFGWLAAQIFALALIACLAKAPRLGRPKNPEPSGADRPVAHPEALGALLYRTGQAGEARSILESYRRWRTNVASSASSSTKTP